MVHFGVLQYARNSCAAGLSLKLLLNLKGYNMYPHQGDMTSQVPAKVLKYETFVNDVLKEDLKKVHSKLDLLNQEMHDMTSLKKDIELFLSQEKQKKQAVKTQMDIGCNFFVQANIARTDVMLLNIGLLHYVEVTFPEALRYVENRMKWLQEQAGKLRKDSALTKAHIKLVLAGLHQLQISESST